MLSTKNNLPFSYHDLKLSKLFMRRFIRNENQHDTFSNLFFAFAQILVFFSKTKVKNSAIFFTEKHYGHIPCDT